MACNGGEMLKPYEYTTPVVCRCDPLWIQAPEDDLVKLDADRCAQKFSGYFRDIWIATKKRR